MPILLYEQERSREAWEMIQQIKQITDGHAEVEKRFRAQVRGASAMIQKNGLGQFLAFLAAKGFSEGRRCPGNKKEAADGYLYQYLGRWMLKAIHVTVNYPARDEVKPGAGRERDPLDFLIHRDTRLDQMLWATREVQMYLAWAKRFAESQLASE